jgi:hypothetical protein
VKKTLFVVALATMLVFAVAGSAFAVNHSGQDRTGISSNAGASVPGTTTNPVPGAGTNTYEDWRFAPATGAGTNGDIAGDVSPHGNYTTTTVKCVVCHSVHYAGTAVGGAPVGTAGTGADTLLRMKASQACVFCHATDGMSVNGRPVYDGLGTAIDGPGETGGNTTTGHIAGTNCSMCHTNVHGANADHSVASLDGFLLKLIPQAAVGDTLNGGAGVPTANMIDAITAIDHQAENQGFVAGAALAGTIGDYASDPDPTLREQAVGIFCAECHDGAYATGAAGAATNVLGSGSVSFTGHRIAAAATNNWNSDGSLSTGMVQNEKTAWAAAANCKACHDATDRYGNKAFPHSWGGTKMWLMSAADAGSVATTLPLGGGANAYNTGQPQLSDGVCLKCHVAGNGTSGVGLTY